MHYNTDMAWFVNECEKANSFAELIPLALAELDKFPDGAEVVCGPISTGGQGNLEVNFRVFGETISKLIHEGNPIFSQVPYEERIFFFRKRWENASPKNVGQYYMPILEEFYHPLIQSGRIRKGWFIPGWESSFGARWERTHLEEIGAEIVELDEEWVEDILNKSQA